MNARFALSSFFLFLISSFFVLFFQFIRLFLLFNFYIGYESCFSTYLLICQIYTASMFTRDNSRNCKFIGTPDRADCRVAYEYKVHFQLLFLVSFHFIV